MVTEFASLQLTRQELVEVHDALLQRAMLEDELRRERGQEEADAFPLLDRVERLIGEREDWFVARDGIMEDELWEYAWYAFTDEWACFRADQDAMEALGAKAEAEALRKRSDKFYRDRFNTYVAEVDMQEPKQKRSVRAQAQGKRA